MLQANEKEREVQHRSSFPCDVQQEMVPFENSTGHCDVPGKVYNQGRKDYHQSLKKTQNSITNAVIVYCTGEGKNNYLYWSQGNTKPKRSYPELDV